MICDFITSKLSNLLSVSVGFCFPLQANDDVYDEDENRAGPVCLIRTLSSKCISPTSRYLRVSLDTGTRFRVADVELEVVAAFLSGDEVDIGCGEGRVGADADTDFEACVVEERVGGQRVGDGDLAAFIAGGVTMNEGAVAVDL